MTSTTDDGNSTGAPNLILCAGIPRSGSTWVYNATRLLFEAAGYITYGCWISEYDPSQSSAIHVVKIHERNDELANKASAIFTSHRDLRDIAGSAWARKWVTDEPSTMQFVENAVVLHTYWLERGAHDLSYAEISDAPLETIKRIAFRLGLVSGVDPSAVHDQLVNLPEFSSETRQYDPVTLLHRRHRLMGGRSGYFGEVLPPRIVSAIETRFGPWLRKYNYAA